MLTKKILVLFKVGVIEPGILQLAAVICQQGRFLLINDQIYILRSVFLVLGAESILLEAAWGYRAAWGSRVACGSLTGRLVA